MWTEQEMQEKMGKIHNIDCLEFMEQVPDNYFDLVLTDPPYGIGASSSQFHTTASAFGGKKNKNEDAKVYKMEYKHSEWDNEIPSKEIFDEIKRISRNQIIFGGNYFIEYLDNTSCLLFWDKCNGASSFADGEIAWTNFKTAVRKYSFKWNGMLQQQMQKKEQRYHPTQKPIELFKMILRDYAVKLDKKTVFDPFMGSGTTAIACKSLGLDWCGCELEADYVAIANKRLERVQGSLF